VEVEYSFRFANALDRTGVFGFNVDGTIIELVLRSRESTYDRITCRGEVAHCYDQLAEDLLWESTGKLIANRGS
jgi:hypothetical protein